MNYDELGLKVGIEVHQELATGHKLFCSCPSKLSEGETEYTFTRRLRPSQSELGEVDPAALFEFMKGKTILYEADRRTNCLVEMDEEPPGPLNGEVLDIVLSFALMVGSRPVDEVHVMRKMVVDGSNTGGFQRTCVTSLGGSVEVDGSSFGLQQISVEEDAARKMGEEGDVVRYRIDRLGIPLIEVATAPDMHTPEEVFEVARRIGSILRSTGSVRRGIGTIRQDLNISVKGGPVVEIKGVQELNLMKTIVEYEALRQSRLMDVAGELKKRNVKQSSLFNEQIDVTDVFSGTECKIIKGAIKAGRRVYAVKLPCFSGLIGLELCPDRRLGTEMADRARYKGGVKGIFHTDELPGYGISPDEVRALRKKAGASEGDAVVIVADEERRSRGALSAVIERAIEALDGVPAETRAANPDGTTRFTRPRPGAARMYPETDVKAITVTPEWIEKLRIGLPKMPEAKLKRFQRDYKLNEKLARQIVDSEYMGLFEELAGELGQQTTLMAVTLTEDLKKLQRDGVPVEVLTDDVIKDVFRAVASKLTVKESIPELLAWLAMNPGSSTQDAVKALGLGLLSREQLASLIDEKIGANMEMVRRMGEKASGPLMGMVMGEVRGRVNASEVQSMIAEKVKAALGGHT
jgi:glutamyl-tRNA(Gln) amidotransferase subunit E